MGCNSAISVCEKGGQWDVALLLLLGEMPAVQLEADAISLCARISACEEGGDGGRR